MLTIKINEQKYEVVLEFVTYEHLRSVYSQLKNNEDVKVEYTDPRHGFSNDYLLIKDQYVCVLDFEQNEKHYQICNGELISILFNENTEYKNTLKKLFNIENDADFTQRLLEYYDLHYISSERLLKTSKISFVLI